MLQIAIITVERYEIFSLVKKGISQDIGLVSM